MATFCAFCVSCGLVPPQLPILFFCCEFQNVLSKSRLIEINGSETARDDLTLTINDKRPGCAAQTKSGEDLHIAVDQCGHGVAVLREERLDVFDTSGVN